LPLVHCVPQLPQLLLAVSRLAHVPLQLTVPVGQLHWLSLHTRLPEQIAPHRPQLFLSDVKSTQVLPHGLKPEVQVMTQAPSAQRGARGGQPLPQLPQLLVFVSRLTQTLPQLLYPAEHVQAPFTHKPPAGQRLPQLPQLLTFVAGSIQTLLHSSWPAEGQPAMQVPFEQV
jgi:hypothetical protein